MLQTKHVGRQRSRTDSPPVGRLLEVYSQQRQQGGASKGPQLKDNDVITQETLNYSRTRTKAQGKQHTEVE